MQQQHFHRNWSLLGMAALVAGAGAWFLAASCAWSPEPAGDHEMPAKREYVGSAICKDCHEEAYALWLGSNHKHGLMEATEETMPPAVVAGEAVIHAPGRTQFRRENGRFLAETVGADGKVSSFHLTHISGPERVRMVRMLVATMPDGRMQVLPAMLDPNGTWIDYTCLLFGGGGTDWGKPPIVKPGDPSFWTGPERSWEKRCARCHESGWEFQRPDENGRGPRATRRALGVDCEQCHGPCSAHVDHHEAKKSGVDPILSFPSLSHSQSVSFCLQCHMNGEVVSNDFQPGDDIFEFRDPSLLVDPEKLDSAGRQLELVHDGVPYSLSRCVSEGKLKCYSCHDPHGSNNPSQLKRPPEDNSLCMPCHEDLAKDLRAHTHHDPNDTGSRCVGCHMPFLPVERGHGIVADHSISTPYFDLKGDRIALNACIWCHEGRAGAPPGAPRFAAAELEEANTRWYGTKANAKPWMQAIGAARLNERGAHVGLIRILRDTSLPRVVRASAVELLGRYLKEVPLAMLVYARDKDSLVRRRALSAMAGLEGQWVDEALLRATTDESFVVRIAAARAALKGWQRVQKNKELLEAILPVLEASAKAGYWDEYRWFLLGAARKIHGDDAGTLEAYQRVVELDPCEDHIRKEVARLKKKLGR
ncbi:MAG: cytochrome c3 family protein [Planctomycetota bacterium]|jgi:predicted CXXCH cytochrome family protein